MRRFISIMGAAAILCLLIVGGRSWTPPRPQDDKELQVKNETASLQLLAQSKESSGEQNLVKLQVINNANKAIVAYTILKQDETMLTTDGSTTGWMLAPGQSDTVRVLVPSADTRLTIFAALFQDGSGEGDFKNVRELKDYRTGVKAQFQRAIPILRQLENETQSTPQILSLRNELLNLPERHEDTNLSVSKSEGAKHAKQFILNQLRFKDDIPDKIQESSRPKVKETLKKLEKVIGDL